jgi:LysR family transcriptional regulator, nod-box dependent transcriptional activator
MRLNQLDMNLILVLDGLLKERSPSKVAARLHVTQPAISAALKRLRTFFDDPLFVPSGRTMTPTPFAQSLAPSVREILLRTEGLTRMRPDTAIASYRRKVTIAASDFISSIVLAPIFRDAAKEAPSISFEVLSVLNSQHHYHEALDRGDVDILILPELFASENHERERLLEEHYVCIAWKRNKLSAATLGLDEYLKAGHVAIADRTFVGHPFDETYLRKLGHARRFEVVVPSLVWMPEMIVDTMRLATIHSRLAADLSRRWPLKVLPCPAAIPPLREVMQWHRYQEHDPAINWMRSKLKSVCNTLSDGNV